LTYTQEELTKICPDAVAEYIDEIILPEWADRNSTAEFIASSMIYESLSRLDLASIDMIKYYQLHGNFALIDFFVVEGINRKVLVAYIQSAFDSWI